MSGFAAFVRPRERLGRHSSGHLTHQAWTCLASFRSSSYFIRVLMSAQSMVHVEHYSKKSLRKEKNREAELSTCWQMDFAYCHHCHYQSLPGCNPASTYPTVHLPNNLCSPPIHPPSITCGMGQRCQARPGGRTELRPLGAKRRSGRFGVAKVQERMSW